MSRRELRVARAAVMKLQAVVRMRIARKEYMKAKSSAVLIQAGFRGALARGGIAAQRHAALWFQAAWRRHRQRACYLKQKHGRLDSVRLLVLPFTVSSDDVYRSQTRHLCGSLRVSQLPLELCVWHANRHCVCFML